jgi:hypothetical protein
MWMIGSTPAFKNCISSRKHDRSYQTLYEDRSVVPTVITRMELHTVCVEDWADKYQGAIAAIATIIVAVFTATLWGSTDKLWKTAEQQSDDMRISLAIAKEAADAARDSADAARHAVDADVSLNEPRIVVQSLELVSYDSADHDKTTLPAESFPVTILRNFGSTPALVSKTSLYCDVGTSALKWDRHFVERFPSYRVNRWPVGTTIMPGQDFVVARKKMATTLHIDDGRRRLIESPSGTGLYAYLLVVFSDLFGREITQEHLFLYCPIEMPTADLRRGFVQADTRQSVKKAQTDRKPP